MKMINELTKDQVIQRIKDGRISAINALHLATTPKDWLIITPGRTYATNNLEKMIRERVIPGLDPEMPADQIQIINVKKCTT